jgi:aspartate dehydrogenase
MLKIGIVGCGAIGSSLARIICRDFLKSAKLNALYDIKAEKSEKLSREVKKNINLKVNTLGELIRKVDLVIEASSARSSFEIAKKALLKRRSIMIMSVGGVLEHIDTLEKLAKKDQARVYIPSGAICGIDALKAAKLGKIKRVTLSTYKNPVAFKGVEYVGEKGINLDGIKGEKVLFSGKAKEAVKFFPQNINVAAVLSLAGIGSSKTKVKIIASSKVKRNIHEIEIESEAGRVFTRTENLIHPDNPKTSFLAVLSAASLLKQILSPLRIGT